MGQHLERFVNSVAVLSNVGSFLYGSVNLFGTAKVRYGLWFTQTSEGNLTICISRSHSTICRSNFIIVENSTSNCKGLKILIKEPYIYP